MTGDVTAWLFGAAVGGWTLAAVLMLSYSRLQNRAIKNLEFARRSAEKWRDMSYDLARECDRLRATPTSHGYSQVTYLREAKTQKQP